MKDLICKAFCNSVTVSELPNGIGYGVSSNLFEAVGEEVGAYILGPDEQGLWRIDDSGRVAPILSASGFDLFTKSRLEIFEDILSRGGASFDRDALEIFVDQVPTAKIGGALIRFFAVLGRVSDLACWSHERVKSTFREDVTEALRSMLPIGVELEENAVVDSRYADLVADIVLRSPNHPPVALYLAQSEAALLEAMLLKSETSKSPNRPRVAAIMERDSSAPKKMRVRAQNRLDVLAVYDGDTHAAVSRIAEEVAPTIQ